uniref:Uncharacterized protein n=1 Tax=viral metagenome TaxID=1070528 RepID=A0A6M3LYX8_9ZZZZ
MKKENPKQLNIRGTTPRNIVTDFVQYMITESRIAGLLSEGHNLADDGIAPFLTISVIQLQFLVEEFLKKYERKRIL